MLHRILLVVGLLASILLLGYSLEAKQNYTICTADDTPGIENPSSYCDVDKNYSIKGFPFTFVRYPINNTDGTYYANAFKFNPYLVIVDFVIALIPFTIVLIYFIYKTRKK